MYTTDEIKLLLGVIRDAKLSAPREMFQESAERLRQICNGVGAESMPEAVRKVLTRAYKCAEASAIVHDYRYTQSDGTPERQQAADDEFLQNGLQEARFRHSWYSWRRWWAERKILIAYRALQEFGECAWCIAFRDNVVNKGEIKK